MQKLIARLALAGMLLGSVMTAVPASAAVTTWDVRGTYVWNVFGVYFHDFVIDTQLPDGSFTGHAGYPSGGAPYTQSGQTTEVVTGHVNGNNIDFHVLYNGPYAPNSEFDMTGTIASDGTISGTVPWSWSLDNHKAQKAYCLDQSADASWNVSWGTNRWQVQNDNGTLKWFQNKPAGKGTTVATYGYDLSYTYGCNGHQILDMLKAKFGDAMNGHYKFGLSSSLLEEFHKDMSDGVLDGKYLLDTVTLNSNNPLGVNSSVPLILGQNYFVEVSGTWANRPGEKVDAKYVSMDNWVTYTEAPTGGYPDDLLEVQIDSGVVNWGVYNSSHTYSVAYVGTGSVANFRVYDGSGNVQNLGWFGDNVGSLTLKIYGQI